MRLKHGLDLEHRHLEAAPDDDVVRAAFDEQEAVVIDPRQIVRPQPAVCRRHRGLRRPDFKKAGLVRRQHAARLGIDHAECAAGIGAAGTAALFGGIAAMVRERPACHRATKLCSAISDENRNVEPALEGLCDCRIKRRRSGIPSVEARQLLGRDIRMEHHAHRRRRQPALLRLVLTHEPRPGLDVQAFHQRQLQRARCP